MSRVSSTERIGEILGAPGDARRLHAAHINPLALHALDLVGCGRDFVRADGLEVWDAQGRLYLDFLAGYGATPLGHNHPEVRAAIEEVLRRSIPHFFLVGPQPLAAALAQRLTRMAPGEL